MLWDNHRRGLPILNCNEHTNSEGQIWEKRGGGDTCRVSDAKKKKKNAFPFYGSACPRVERYFLI